MYTPCDSVHRFRTRMHPIPKKFLLPSAISLETRVLTSDGVAKCKMTGVQYQVCFYLGLGSKLEVLSPCLSVQSVAKLPFGEVTSWRPLTWRTWKSRDFSPISHNSSKAFILWKYLKIFSLSGKITIDNRWTPWTFTLPQWWMSFPRYIDHHPFTAMLTVSGLNEIRTRDRAVRIPKLYF